MKPGLGLSHTRFRPWYLPGPCSLKMLPTFAAPRWRANSEPRPHEFRLSLSTAAAAAAKHSNDDALVPSFALANEPRSVAETEIKVNDAFYVLGVEPLL